MREKLAAVVPEFELRYKAELAFKINELKRERNAVILGHNYMEPALYHSIPDFTGDSLELCRKAATTDADIIVFCGVRFMAETAKILNPRKTVLIPSPKAGCSLAESITAEDVRGLRKRFPGVPVVTYVNTYADVKAESDICCTSGNARGVVESLGVPRVILVPDEYLARNVAAETSVEIISWRGRCEVHERFTAAEVRALRAVHPEVMVLAHPECSPEVVKEADYVGSTQGMSDYLARVRPGRVVLLTECSMSDNVSIQHPRVDFVRPCNLCPHMKRITLGKIRTCLEALRHEVAIEAAVALRARRAVERMLQVRGR